jgi:hypothetical protein
MRGDDDNKIFASRVHLKLVLFDKWIILISDLFINYVIFQDPFEHTSDAPRWDVASLSTRGEQHRL